MPIRDRVSFGDTQSALDDLRKGTRKQFESAWTTIGSGSSVDITHDLGEIPWAVDVIRADGSEGYGAVQAPSTDITVSKTDATITLAVGTTAGATYFYKVRAM